MTWEYVTYNTWRMPLDNGYIYRFDTTDHAGNIISSSLTFVPKENKLICLISPTLLQAQKFASTNNLSPTEWFYGDEKSVVLRTNYHTLVIAEFPEERLWWFEKIYKMAKRNGSVGR
jgi:hypothetical protein